MSFLNPSYSATVAARLTDTGRNAIAKGNFVVSYFAVGDSEYNYNGGNTQNVFAPLDKNTNVKYPIWYTSGTTVYGVPVQESQQLICRDVMESDGKWTLNTVWEKTPIGVSGSVTGHTSNKYIGVKNFLGYTSSSGQTYNTGTTIFDTTGTAITLSPEEQKAVAILHYSENNLPLNDTEGFFKYDDYISTWSGITADSVNNPTLKRDYEYFNVNLATLLYHRSSSATTGASFKILNEPSKYIVSNYNSKSILEYKNLYDALDKRVGKVFYNQKTIVFDDEEIVAALDAGSNRLYTLPKPKVDTIAANADPITVLTNTKTLWVTYMLSGTTETLPCMYFTKVTGSTGNQNVTVKFNSGEFKHLNNGYTASKFYILHQLVDNGLQPSPTSWKINKTSYNTDLNNNIDNLKTGFTFTINQTKYDAASTTYTFSPLSSFGNQRYISGLTGSNVSVVRESKIEEMIFKANLPTGKFESSQNPTFTTGNTIKITEVALLDSNKDVLVVGKLSTPVTKSGSQVISVKLDF
jgi:hypothetical protein